MGAERMHSRTNRIDCDSPKRCASGPGESGTTNRTDPIPNGRRRAVSVPHRRLAHAVPHRQD